MRKILIGVAAVIVLLVAAALVVPSFLDWNRYKDRIAAEAEAATGRRLTIAGDVGLRVLPFPQLRVRDVRFANAPGAAVPDMVSLKALEVDVAFWPLLSGRVDTTRVTLVEPVIELQALPDGSGNWAMKPAAPAGAPAASAPSASGAAGSAPGDGLQIRLANVSIENGTVVWRDAAGGVERIEGIQVQAAAESLQGPFRASGEMQVRGRTATLDADVGRLDPTAKTPVRVALALKDVKAGVVVTAALGPEAPARRVDGTLSIEAESVAAVTAALTGTAAGPARPFAAEIAFQLEGDRFKADPLTLRIDDTQFSGGIETGPDANGRTAIRAALSTPRLDLDKWRTAIAAPGAKPASNAPATGGPPAGAGFALPAGIDARLDIAADTVLVQGQTIRQAKLVARLADGKVTVERAGAELAGPTTVAVSGTLAAVQGRPQFDGRLQVDSRSLRTLLTAGGTLPAGLPADRLGRATVQAQIKATPQVVEVANLAATLDGTKASGAATVRLPAQGARLGIGARVAVDRLDLDPWLKAAPGKPAAPAPASAAPAAGSAAAPVDPGLDFDVDLRVGQLAMSGRQARDVVVVAALQAGTLTLRQASVGDYGGASAKLSGTVRDLGPQAAFDLTLEAGGKDLGRALSQGGVAAPAQAQQPFSIGGKVAGTAAKLTLDLAARVGEGQAKIAGTVEPPRGMTGIALTVDAAHPATGRLLSQLAPGYRPQGGDIGPFRLTAKTRAEGGTLFLDGFSLAAGPARLEGPVRIETAGPRPKLVADLTGGELSVDAFLPVEKRADAGPPRLRPGVMLAQARPAQRPAQQPAQRSAAGERWSRAPLDLSALTMSDADVKLRAASFRQGRWLVTKPDIAMTLADGTLTLARFTGALYGGTAEITGRLVARGTPNARLEIKAQNVNLGQAIDTGRTIRLIGGRMQANLAVETAGRSQWEMVSALAGRGDLDVRDGTLRGLNLSAVANSLQSSDLTKLPNILGLVQELGKDGDTPFSSLTATYRIERGILRSDDMKLAAVGFTAAGTTVTSLPAWTTDTRVEAQIATKPQPVPVGVRLEGPIDDPRKIFDTNALQSYLAQRVGGGGLKQLLPGIIPQGQPQQQPQKPGQPAQQPQQQPRNLLEQLSPLLRR
ncbi:cell envelope biogenesis protein AsmA [Allostella sp. ATCC 35155]|nr:cell envelope biogenesis protein AsmA [Stella sp. ATCC 35155]